MSIFNCRGQILARQVLEDLHQYAERCRGLDQRVPLHGTLEQRLCGLPQENEEWRHEALDYEVNRREEVVGADLGAPGPENGMRGFQHTEVDVVVGLRERADELLL